MKVTMTVTMTLGEWKALRDQLYGKRQSFLHPAAALTSLIYDTINQAEQVFTATEKTIA